MKNKILFLIFFLFLLFAKASAVNAAINKIVDTPGDGGSNFSRQAIFQILPAGTLPTGYFSRLDIQTQYIDSGLNNPYTISICQGTLDTITGHIYRQRYCGTATIVAVKQINFTSTGTTTVNFLKRYAISSSLPYYWVMAGGGTSTSSGAVVWSRSDYSTSRINGRFCGSSNDPTDDYCHTIADNTFALYDDTSLVYSWQIATDYITIVKPVSTTTPTLFAGFTGWQLDYGMTSTTTNYYLNYDLYVTIDYNNNTKNKFYSATTTGLARYVGQIGSSAAKADTAYTYSWLTENYRPQELGNYIATATLWAKGAVNRYSIALATTTFTLATSTGIFGQSGWCVGICDDLATSSFAADLICAGRITFCQIFFPHSSSLDYLATAYEDFKKVFPFNTFFSLTDTVKNTISSTTLTANDTLGIPMIRKTATGSAFYILPVLASSSMPATIGAANTNIFRTTIGYIFWGVTGLIVFFILF
jgi:hypothetical protein